MVPITSAFQSEAPLHPKAAQLLADVFDRGWADPAKIHQDSRSTGALLYEAKETFAGAFGVRPDEIYFLGEPPLGFHLGINGLIEEDSRLFYSGTDRAPVHAIVDGRNNHGFKNELDSTLQSTQSTQSTPTDILVYQSVNPETGIHKPKPDDFMGRVFVDNTAYGIHSHLPTNWATAAWQSRSWQGPAGLGVFAVRTGAHWHNPLPHNDSSKVPQSFSIPLALASAVALENFTKDYVESQNRIKEFKSAITQFLVNDIGGAMLVGDLHRDSPLLMSALINDIDAEKLVNDLNQRGIFVDSGSACNSSNLQPSHVLAAMGLPTAGNIRLTIHPQTTQENIDILLKNLKELVAQQRL